MPTMKQTKPHIEDDGLLYGVIEVEINDIIDRDLEQFLDFISEKLTGTEVLSDIQYSVVGHKMPDAILLEVSGDPHFLLEHNADLQEQWNQMEKRIAAKEKSLSRHQRKRVKRSRKKIS